MFSRKLFLVLGFFLIGCTVSNPNGQPMPAMTFDHLESLPVAVASVQVGQPPDRPVQASHMGQFIVPPDEAVHEYLVKRLVPKGIKGKLKINIEEAGVFHLRKPSSNNFNRFFGVGRTEEYNLVIKLNLILLDDSGREEQSKLIKGTRIIRVSEHASLANLEKAQFKGVESLLIDIDEAIIRTVRDDFQI